MLPGLLKRLRWPIGLELGSREVRMLQLAGAKSDWQVRGLAERALTRRVALDDPVYHQGIAEAVQAMVAEGRFSGREVVTAPPAAALQIKNLRLPPMPAAELADAVMWEATDRLKIDRRSNEIRFFNAGEVRQGGEIRQEVILLAVPRLFVEAHVQAMAGVGLEVVGIDAPMAALARTVCEPAPELPLVIEPVKVPAAPAMNAAPAPPAASGSDTHLIVQVDDESTQVIIVQQRGIVFFKVIDFGLATLHQAWQAAGLTVHDPAAPDEPARAAAQTPLADLARELGLCLRYYSVTFRGDRLSEMVLTGVGATRWLAEQLAEQASVTVRRAELVDGTASTGQATSESEASAASAVWCTALGLSLGQARSTSRGTQGRAA